MPCASEAAFGLGQDRNSNEGANEEDIEQDPDPAERAATRVGALLDAAEESGNQGVEHCSCKDAFNGTV